MPKFDRLPPLSFTDGDEPVDELVPGLIVADPSRGYGEPTIAGTGIKVSYGWLREVFDAEIDAPYRCDVRTVLHDRALRTVFGDLAPLIMAMIRDDEVVSHNHLLAAVAFNAGVEWQRSRTRRARMAGLVKDYWAKVRAKAHKETT